MFETIRQCYLADFFLDFHKNLPIFAPKKMFFHYYSQTKSTLTMDKNLLQKAKAPMIALIQTKNIIYSKHL